MQQQAGSNTALPASTTTSTSTTTSSSALSGSKDETASTVSSLPVPSVMTSVNSVSLSPLPGGVSTAGPVGVVGLGLSGGGGEDPRNLIVNYIPTPVTDTELRQLFEQFGDLESARVILDRVTQHPKGYGFVKFRRVEDAKVAMDAMNGFEIHNKRLKVTTAKGPSNAAIDNHTQKLQTYVATQVQATATGGAAPATAVATPQGSQFVQVAQVPQQGFYPGAPGQPQYIQQIVTTQPGTHLVQYVVVDQNMQPINNQFGSVAVPQQYFGQAGPGSWPPGTAQPMMQPAPQHIFFQPAQHAVPLAPSTDPMNRDSCRFSVSHSVSQYSSQQGQGVLPLQPQQPPPAS